MWSPDAILIAHAATTLYMAGVIWFVQLVHYPLFRAVGQEQFAGYEIEHAGRTTWVVAVPMIIEAATAVLLAFRPHEDLPGVLAWTGLGLLSAIWFSTFLFQVPLHARLSGGFKRDVHDLLVMTNWVRTLGWTARAWLVLVMVAAVVS